jgi:hypothetical protein
MLTTKSTKDMKKRRRFEVSLLRRDLIPRDLMEMMRNGPTFCPSCSSCFSWCRLSSAALRPLILFVFFVFFVCFVVARCSLHDNSGRRRCPFAPRARSR